MPFDTLKKLKKGEKCRNCHFETFFDRLPFDQTTLLGKKNEK